MQQVIKCYRVKDIIFRAKEKWITRKAVYSNKLAAKQDTERNTKDSSFTASRSDSIFFAARIQMLLSPANMKLRTRKKRHREWGGDRH